LAFVIHTKMDIYITCY